MPNLLSPGIFIEEVPAQTQIVQGVSTSNMGIVGWTPQGPANMATYVTSFNQFIQIFGSFDSRSFLAYAVAGFYFNGGATAYIVRVTPTDATVATGAILGLHSYQQIEIGDGVSTTYSETPATTTLLVAAGAAPIQPGKNGSSSTASRRNRRLACSLTPS